MHTSPPPSLPPFPNSSSTSQSPPTPSTASQPLSTLFHPLFPPNPQPPLLTPPISLSTSPPPFLRPSLPLSHTLSLSQILLNFTHGLTHKTRASTKSVDIGWVECGMKYIVIKRTSDYFREDVKCGEEGDSSVEVLRVVGRRGGAGGGRMGWRPG